MVHSATLLKAEVKELVRSTQTQQEEGSDTVRHQRSEGKRRRCGLYNQVGHNAHTCEAPQDSIEVE
jgi:hypothetical protein